MFTNYRKYYRKYFVLERSTSELAGYYRLTSKISCDNYHLYGLQKNWEYFVQPFGKKPINCWKKHWNRILIWTVLFSQFD